MKKLIALLTIGLQMLGTAMAGIGDTADFRELDNKTFYINPVKAEELKGKVVFIEYWGLWCPPCRAAMPELQALYEKYKGEGFVVVATHCQQADAKKVLEFLQQQGITFPVCSYFYLPEAPVPNRIPRSVLIGADGKVVALGRPGEVVPLVEAEMEKLRACKSGK